MQNAEEEGKNLRPARKTVEKLFTRAEALELLNFSRPTLQRLIMLGARTKGREGIYPAYDLLGTQRGLRIPEGAIVRFLERKKITP